MNKALLSCRSAVVSLLIALAPLAAVAFEAKGDPFTIPAGIPVYNSDRGEFLLVRSLAVAGSQVIGQRIDAATGEPLGDAFPISDAVASEGARFALAAYNPAKGEYLVVWQAFDSDKTVVLGQRIDGLGNRVGADFQISQSKPLKAENVYSQSVQPVDVVYDSTDNQYLILLRTIEEPVALADIPDHMEVFGQRVDADGHEIGEDDFRISPSGDITDAVFSPHVVYNADANEYFVVWQAYGNGGIENAISGLRLKGDTSVPVGPGVFRISTNAFKVQPDIAYIPAWPLVAYNPDTHEYLVVWVRDDGGDTSRDFEAFGQRINAETGEKVGENEFQMSDAGVDERYIGSQSFAYDPVSRQYLLVWVEDKSDPFEGDARQQVYGQLFDGATCEETGDNDFLINAENQSGSSFWTTTTVGTNQNLILVTWWNSVIPNGIRTDYYGRLFDISVPAAAPTSTGGCSLIR